jgi:hypothetical protein
MLHRTRILSFVLFTALVTPAAASAQERVVDHTAPAAGPRIELTSTAMRATTVTSTQSANAAMARRQNLGQPMALMIVGGAALLAGIIIGGDAGTLIAIGGVVAGLIGLYQYLQ